MALVAQAATLRARVPFVHFFDGFRTSHEVNKIEQLSIDDLRAMIDEQLVRAHRERAMDPDRPVLRGTAQNPDVFFQAREAANPFHNAVPEIVQSVMDQLAGLVGRQYHLFDYVGEPQAERVIVMMGSGAGAAERPWRSCCGGANRWDWSKSVCSVRSTARCSIKALPATVRGIAVLDRTKEPGSIGEPLYQDVVTALVEHWSLAGGSGRSFPAVIGGRYGLSSKEFTPAMAARVLEELQAAQPKRHFTVGIIDDVTHESALGPRVFNRRPGRDAGPVLRAGQRWHRRRDEKLRENHR